MPKDEFFWAIVVLTLVYSRTCPRSTGPVSSRSTPASRPPRASLGLSQVQTMRHVIVPQAGPPGDPRRFLNDFIGLQKDTVLVSYIGIVEIFRQTARSSRRPRQTSRPTSRPPCGFFLVITIPLARVHGTADRA